MFNRKHLQDSSYRKATVADLWVRETGVIRWMRRIFGVSAIDFHRHPFAQCYVGTQARSELDGSIPPSRAIRESGALSLRPLPNAGAEWPR